jgi:hypothetical protein
MTRRMRWGAPLALALVALMAGAALAYSWDPPNAGAANPGRLGPNYTWDNGDPVLANNQDGSLSAAYVSDYTKGVFADDGSSGPWLSNFYTRSQDGGATWSKPVRLNGKYHADRVTLVSSGSHVVTFFMSQVHYWATPGGSTFKTSEPRYVYVRTNTNNGAPASWTAAKKLPGQSTNSRGDYLWAASDGNLVVVATTNTANGKIWTWRSTDGGVTFTGPIQAGTTTATDTTSGYVGGLSGLPAVAVHGTTVIVGWVASPAGQVVTAISTDSGATYGSPTTRQASGGNANNGYVQADDRSGDNRMAFTWTTASGAFLQIYDDGTNTWGTKRTIATFPDSDPGVGSVYNKGGEGATVALGSGSTVGISLSECNTANGFTCNNPQLSDTKARSQLVWRESSDNGASWGNPEIIKAPGTAKGSYINDYGDVIYLPGGKPFVLWNGHNSAYSAYTVQIRVGN